MAVTMDHVPPGFGKRFSDSRLADLPTSRLIGFFARGGLPPEFAAAVLAELECRGALPRGGTDRLRMAQQIIELGWRGAARRHHPDVGGDDAAMREVVAARDWLRALVGGR